MGGETSEIPIPVLIAGYEKYSPKNRNTLSTIHTHIKYSPNTIRLIKNLDESPERYFSIFKYVPGDIKYIFTKIYQHISTNNEANRKFVILISIFFIRS
jgi:hypothetical protein